jgi:hypothetical protein
MNKKQCVESAMTHEFFPKMLSNKTLYLKRVRKTFFKLPQKA